jgi:hypothetical protein
MQKCPDVAKCLRLAEFAKHGIDRVESRIDLLSDLTSK